MAWCSCENALRVPLPKNNFQIFFEGTDYLKKTFSIMEDSGNKLILINSGNIEIIINEYI